MGSVRKSESACCEIGPRATVPTRRFFLTTQLAEKIPTRIVISLEQRLLEHHLNTAVVQCLISNNLPQLDRRFASFDLHCADRRRVVEFIADGLPDRFRDQ